jgi:steroid 5-alpha reductase family enzyme
MNFWLYLYGLMAMLAPATSAWVVSVIKRDVSIVDSMWAVMLLLAALVYAGGAEPYGGRTWLILVMVFLWAVRLSGHIVRRNWGEPEDRRYQDIRQKYEPHFALKSLGIIFWFQAGLAWLISMPLWPALTVPVEGTVFDVLAVTLWTAGMIFEGIGDWQLSRFRADPLHRNKVMDRGLWRYTRHPNYFGECLIWWGFYFFALPTGAWWTALGPLLLTYMLMKFSGVPLVEQTIVERRPAYRDYIARTNAFIPGPPKQGMPLSIPESRHHD